ncbi:MAG: glycosyltransferase family 2 protein [Planctomycetota bacterium]
MRLLPDTDAERLAVIIPAFNEEPSLPLVLGDLPRVGRVIVVNNASTDQTAAVARDAGAEVIDEPRRGYGSACLAGLRALRDDLDRGVPAPAVVVFLDGDYSDHPEELPALVEPIFSGDCDMVLGSRLMGDRERGAMPPQSVWGNRFACWLMRLLLGANYTDLGPFRAIRYTSLASLGMADTNYGWTVEMQIKATRAGLRVREAPVRYRRRVGVSKISGTVTGTVKAGAKILWTVARYGLLDRNWKPTALGSEEPVG